MLVPCAGGELPIRAFSMPQTQIRTCLSAAVGLAAVGAAAFAQSDPIVAEFPVPSADRWNYPFNPTPGARWTASTFGNEPGAPLFDNRDGQMVVAFDTGPEIPSGLGAARYEILSVQLVVENAVDGTWSFDPTPDPWQSYLPLDDPQWIPDEDGGEAIELFGVGFRHGLDAASWQENTPFGVGDPLDPSVRTAFPVDFVGGVATDVSNSVREQFDPTPWAVGIVDGIAAGDPVPYGAAVAFEVDLGRSVVASYIADGLDRGRLILAVTSLAKVVQQGSTFPAFHCKESPLVAAGFANAARLEVVVRIVEANRPGDLDGDGHVSGADLAVMLSQWGGAGSGDLDGDGAVGGADLAVLLSHWG
jgi:hypothetical protein